MSDSKLSEYPAETSGRRVLLNAIGFTGVLFIFLLIVLVAYLPNRPLPVDHERVEERWENYHMMVALEKDALSHYGWVDKSKGMVRIPVERAMVLTLKELSNKTNPSDPDNKP